MTVQNKYSKSVQKWPPKLNLLSVYILFASYIPVWLNDDLELKSIHHATIHSDSIDFLQKAQVSFVLNQVSTQSL